MTKKPRLDAKHVGIAQSLIVTCRLHGIDPYTYLVDVLQRVGQHPASRVAELLVTIMVTLSAGSSLSFASEFVVEMSGKDISTKKYRVSLTESGFSIQAGETELGGIPDELVLARPLGSMPEAGRVGSAYWSSFHQCGVNDEQQVVAITSDSLVDGIVNASQAVPLVGKNALLVVGQFRKSGAIIGLDDFKVYTPQCPAGIAALFWSYPATRILAVAKQVKRVKIHGASPAWETETGTDQSIYYYDVSGDFGFRKLLSLSDEVVMDAYVAADKDEILILTKSERRNLLNPPNWLPALAGHPPTKSDIIIRRLGRDGAVLSKAIIEKSVQNGSAGFYRQKVEL